NKTITIRAVYYVQTEGRPIRGGGTIRGYRTKDVAKMETKINTWLNKQNLSVTEGEYEGYSIQFNLTFREGGSSLQTRMQSDQEQYEGHDIGNSIERGNSKSDPLTLSLQMDENGNPKQRGGFTQHDKNILMHKDFDSQINRIHEIAHTLGLDDNVKTGAK